MFGEMIYNKFKNLYSSAIGTNLAIGSPASGYYVDVSDYVRVHILATFGVIHDSDTPAVEPRCADSVSGTPDQLSASLVYTPNVTTGEGLAAMWTIEVASLPTDHHFILLYAAGTLSNGTKCHVQIFGEPKVKPPTQDATINYFQYGYAGGQADNS
jgi:hypothetical protein